jgi:MFS family permease
MALLSKPMTDEQKENMANRMVLLGIISIGTQTVCLLSDTALFVTACGGDAVQAAYYLGVGISSGSAIEFVANPFLGKLSDQTGRRWVYFIAPVVAGLGGSLLVLATGGTSLPALIAHRISNSCTPSMSFSLMFPVAISDMYSGVEYGVRAAKAFASIGLALIFAPPLGTLLISVTGNIMNVYKLRLIFAVVQLIFTYVYVEETLQEKNVRQFRWLDANPLSFIRLFTRSRALGTLALTVFFNCFAEGKAISSMMNGWLMGPPMHFPLPKQTLYTSLFGVAAFSSGTFLVPRMLSTFGPRRFTDVCNAVSAVGFLISSAPLYLGKELSAWGGLLFQAPGANNTASAACKGMALDQAVAAGFGRGEYGGMYSSLRSLAMVLAPAMYSVIYTKAQAPSSGLPALPLGASWIAAALLGNGLPLILHRTLSDADLGINHASKK